MKARLTGESAGCGAYRYDLLLEWLVQWIEEEALESVCIGCGAYKYSNCRRATAKIEDGQSTADSNIMETYGSVMRREAPARVCEVMEGSSLQFVVYQRLADYP